MSAASISQFDSLLSEKKELFFVFSKEPESHTKLCTIFEIYREIAAFVISI